MKKIMFFCIPAHGHTNPMLPVAKEEEIPRCKQRGILKLCCIILRFIIPIIMAQMFFIVMQYTNVLFVKIYYCSIIFKFILASNKLK